MLEEATMWSPQEAMLNRAKKLAAWPEEVSMAAVPPSSWAILAATKSLVGFWRRV
jgi:hypothetical protein